ncbi:MFS transporter [Candidatus Bipolaricaulota bacterium]
MKHSKLIQGIPAFGAVLSGQFLSMIGTGMTRFALTIWAWQLTGQATALALVGFFSFLPMMIVSPLAGALVDRWNRKITMMISDLAAGLATIAVFILFLLGQLELWHLFAAASFTGIFEAFQFPAYRSSVTTMIPKQHFARATGLIQLAGYGSGILAPIAAAALIGQIGIGGIMMIDIVTFTFAVGVLFFVRIPQPARSVEGAQSQGSLWQESIFGFRYIFRHKGLLGLQTLLFSVNLVSTIAVVLMPAMLLARTGGSEIILGSVQAAIGIGGVAGGILFSIWGGPKRLIHGALLGMAAMMLFGVTGFGISRALVPWIVTGATMSLFGPMLNGCLSGIWQRKVPADIQGKVFAIRRTIAEAGRPLAMLAAGPLADHLLEPAMTGTGTLARVFGPVVGTGPGAGMGLMFVFAGIIAAAVALTGYLFPLVRDIEVILPDQDVIIERSQSAGL